MNRSGMKRGLAVSAISALALSGLALAPAQAQTIAQAQAGGVNLYTGEQSGAYTNQFDGKNSSVQLLAGVNIGTFPAANSVRFSYLKGATQVNIATVPLFNGVATADWVAPAGAEGGAITDIRAEVLDVNAAVLATNTNGVVGTATPNVGAQPVSINGALRDEVGINLDGEVVVTGKTREAAAVGSPFANTLVTNRGPVVVNASIPAIATDVADINALTPYAALVPVAGNTTADALDEIVIQTRIFAQGDDTQVFSAYDQVPTTTSKATAPGFPANVAGGGANQETRWVISVKDQKGKPLSGLDVYESNVAGVDQAAAFGMGRTVADADFDAAETDFGGTVTVRLNEAAIDGADDQDPAAGVGATYVVVDYDQDGVFDNGSDQLLKLTNTNLPQAPASVTITSSLGAAMDDDESTTLTFTVKDANGDPVQGAALTGAIARDVADNTPVDSTTPLAIPNTDVDGKSTVVVQPGVNNNKVGATVTATSGAASAAPFAIATDEAVVAWDSGTSAQALANTSTTQSGTVKLPSGTVLPGRTVGLTLIPNDNAVYAPQASQPAGTIRGGDLVASATTSATGAFSVVVTDPAAPVGQDLDNTIRATSPALAVGNVDLDLDFLRSLTPTQVVVYNDDGGSTDTTDGLDGEYVNQQGNGGLLPDSLAEGGIAAFNADGVRLVNLPVTVTIDEGFFANRLNPFKATPVPGAVVQFGSIGKSITVNTSGDGIGEFYANIERNTGFDDDGIVADTITATVGGATDDHDFTWTTVGTPVTQSQTAPLSVSLSDVQESSILPKARAGTGAAAQVVNYDVETFDQYGNPTSQLLSVTDNSPVATFSTPGSSQLALGQPSIVASSPAAATQSLEVEINNAQKFVYKDNVNTSAFDPANPGETVDTQLTDVQRTTDAVNWYVVDDAASTFVLAAQGEAQRPVGSAVTMTITATDQEGQPLNGYDAQFLRVGPGDDDDDTYESTFLPTNGDGQAFYDFVGSKAGVASVTAVVRNDADVRVANVGPRKVTFGTAGGAVAIKPSIVGSNTANGDVVTITAKKAPGADVKLFKKTATGRVLVKFGTLGANGIKVFRVADRNGKTITRYFAVVSATSTTKKGTTKVVGIR
ncbi:hypothetical protein [Nocardioides psychrotolerans]|uniref:hypothetical protein n=1 Tax=Nocardioides psychrotolerans TaxID=1005945 RepID=UPI0031379498